MPVNPRATARAVLTVVALLLVAACSDTGSGDGTETAAGEPTSTTTSTTEAPPEYTSEVYADLQTWLCHPERSDDACDADLDATLVESDGTTTVERFEPADDAPVDCFYVYPTTSDDATPNSDLVPTESERNTARSQIARFASTCRVFAPMYRQVTLAGLFSDDAAADWGLAYADVADAWRHYLANDNDGRGVVLVGHSQGSGHLVKLLDEEIDPDERSRELLVSAVITGGTVAVPAGEVVGGDLAEIPLCESPDQTGCVVTYSTYADDEPPAEGSFFGVPRSGEGRAGCVNPAALDGGPAPLDSYFPTAMVPVGELDPAIDTPFVHLDGLVQGECVEEGRHDYLEATLTPEEGDARPDDIGGKSLPGWGLHLHDIAVAQGSLIDLVGRQAEAYADR